MPSMLPSSGPGPRYNPDAPVQPIQIIVFALMLGVTIFAVVAVFSTLNRQGGPDESSAPIAAAVLAAAAVVARFLIPPLVARSQMQNVIERRRNDNPLEIDQAIYEVFQTRTIIEGGILEGAALFAIVAFMVSSQWWLLGVPGALIALMLVTFPTKGRIEQFIHEHKQQLDFEGDR
ncbi:MAG: hypothetical protein WD648_02415 [Planctomycetaceae bacterium]